LLLVQITGCAQTATSSYPDAASVPGNPALGRLYAEQSCAECHAITPGAAASPLPEAPTFSQVANTPGMTRIALNAWLHSPHPSMPQLIVPPERIDDLSAYLATLKQD